MTRDNDHFCDYCQEDLDFNFYLRAVELRGKEIIVKTWCGHCETPDDVDPAAQAALEDHFRMTHGEKEKKWMKKD